MSKMKDRIELVKEIGPRHWGFLFGTMFSLLVFKWIFGSYGLYAGLGLWALVTVVKAKDFWSKTFDVGERLVRWFWIQLVTVGIFLFLLWAVSHTFATVAVGPIAQVMMTVLSAALAIQYMRSKRRWMYHTFAIFVCSVYLFGSVMALVPEKYVSGAAKSRWLATAKKLADAITDNSAGIMDSWVRTLHDGELARRYRSEELPVVSIDFEYRGKPYELFARDFLDDTGISLSSQVQPKDSFLVDRSQEKDFEGLRYVFAYHADLPNLKGWLRYRVILLSEMAKDDSETQSSSPTSTASSGTPSAGLPKGKTATPRSSSPPATGKQPLAPVVIPSSQSLAVTDSVWAISEVATTRDNNVLWYGPFSKREEAAPILVCVSGGDPVDLDPMALFRTPNGGYIGKVTWNYKPWDTTGIYKAWMRLKPGTLQPGQSPVNVTVWRKKPF